MAEGESERVFWEHCQSRGRPFVQEPIAPVLVDFALTEVELLFANASTNVFANVSNVRKCVRRCVHNL